MSAITLPCSGHIAHPARHVRAHKVRLRQQRGAVAITFSLTMLVMLGLLSAIVDNVPLVAASMGMYSTAQFPIDSFLWHFIAYCAGTGGSILIIGSAAGVAAMSLEKIQFIWYLRKISGLALIGYLAGAAAYVAQYQTLH